MKKFYKMIIDVIEVHFSVIFFLLLFVSMIGQVVMRYILNNPSPALYEISSYSFVWVTLLSAAYAKRLNKHIRFNILVEKFSRKKQIVIEIIFDIIVIFTFSISLYPVISQSIWYKIIKSQVLRIPWTYLIICLPLFMILLIIHNIESIIEKIKEFKQLGEK
ncbi:TRAP transporter small permease [Thermosipho atlanticus]|uniref:TRAP-type C4-dicarboxylate transport system, small permease component n=1 Tax=Thermosipho atlanticus DSM 15807 TaxID=1123380 RepID=A0A1M5TVD3_9BACT|nr:TRAP transporter small permease [Thermosipho atlanticus]SHH54648.1 TRAP-type C4-dicarboxylate transport system, small permease component [Thermosipho atlanticus DSM 15807]